MEVEVRTGVEEDFHEVMRLAIDATQENAFIAPDMVKLAMPIYGVLTKQIPGIIGVIGEVGGRLEGAILLNIGEILAAAGASFDHVVRTTVFLASMDDFTAMNEVYSGFFGAPAPARATVAASGLPKNARLEIDVVAYLP